MAIEVAQLSAAKRALLQKYLQGDTPRRATAPQPIPRRASTGPAPLSYGQQQLWLLAQMAPDTPFYNECVTIHLPGPFNTTIFARSFNEILRRHEMWRTTFRVLDGQPVQIVHPAVRMSLPLIDLQHLPHGAREAEALRIATADAWRPFDLTSGPLLRARLIRLAEEDHRLFLTLHHIIFDGVSIYNVLLPELAAVYEAFSAGAPSPLPELPIQYADYAQWQRAWLQGDRLTNQLAYWRQQLAGDLPVLQLPTDRPRPARQTYRGALHRVAVAKPLTDALKEVSRREGATLFMTLLAAFTVLLSRYTGQDDILVGSVTAGRHRSEMEKLLGFFLNTLVLRTSVAGNPSFREVLARVREVTLAAMAHEHVPFELVVKDLQPERDVSRNPLFQVMFTLEPPLPPLANHWSLSQLDVDTRTAKFDLSLELDERHDGIIGRFEYNTDLFTDATITRMLQHFYMLLEQIVADPGRRVAELPLLTPAERQQILVTWNATEVEYPRELCLHHLIEAQVARTPEAIAVVYEERQLTYRELNARANQLAQYLGKHGVGPEVLVGLYLDRSLEMVIGVLGILKAGGAYVPLDPSYPHERLAFMIDDAALPVLLTQQRLVAKLPPHNAELVCLDSDWPAIATESTESVANPVSGVGAENLAYVIYTSGSTGKPKGVQIPHRAVVNFLSTMRECPGMTATDTLLAVTTLSFDIAALELFWPLTVGARVVVASREVATDGATLVRTLQERHVTVMQATPATWRMLVDVGWHGGPHFTILCGGEVLPQDLAEQLLSRGAQLWNLYGPTETTIWSALHRVTSVTGPIPIGRPIANTQVYILDQQLHSAPIGVAGELYIGGAGLARGYLNRPELTAEKFIPSPFNDDPGTRLYKTGDLARYLPDGNIEYLGRIDLQVKLRGFRIELGEIETSLSQHPAVRQAIVVVHDNGMGNQRLVAYLVPQQKPGPTPGELQGFLQRTLPNYMVPSAFVPLDTLPRTPNGKVDRRMLPAPAQTRPESEKVFAVPQDVLEVELTQIWEKVLNVKPLGVRDNFFALGGHSLLAVRLFVHMEQHFGRTLPLATFFQAPTIEQLATILRKEGWSAREESLRVMQPESIGTGRLVRNIARYIPTKYYLSARNHYRSIQQLSGYRYLIKQYVQVGRKVIQHFLPYAPSQLEALLKVMGLTKGDTVFMHSAFRSLNGFTGAPQEVIDCVLRVIGEDGNLLMVSMPYSGSSYDYFQKGEPFDVAKTPSVMGVITELFRRKHGVVRSLNPVHPLLAYGPAAQQITEGHENTMYSCGKDSPFAKILNFNPKILFFDVPLESMTFFHYLEDMFQAVLPYKLYDREPVECVVVDPYGHEIKVKNYVFSAEARRRRSMRALGKALKKNNRIKIEKIGNTKLMLVNLRQVVDSAQEVVRSGGF